MMDYFDEINAVHSLFLKELREPFDNQLLICLEAGVVSRDTNDLKLGEVVVSDVRNVEAKVKAQNLNYFLKVTRFTAFQTKATPCLMMKPKGLEKYLNCLTNPLF